MYVDCEVTIFTCRNSKYHGTFAMFYKLDAPTLAITNFLFSETSSELSYSNSISSSMLMLYYLPDYLYTYTCNFFLSLVLFADRKELILLYIGIHVQFPQGLSWLYFNSINLSSLTVYHSLIYYLFIIYRVIKNKNGEK